MKQRLNRKETITIFTLSLLVSLLAGAGAIKLDSLFSLFLSFPGAVFFMFLIGGPHGGGNTYVDIFAGTVAALVNAAIWHAIFKQIYLRRKQRQAEGPISIVSSDRTNG